MKVLLFNGSPHAKGCTYTALHEVEKELNEQGIETEVIQVGNQLIHGCAACGYCYTHPNECAFKDDLVNEVLEKTKEADGFIFGSPVYYASCNGVLSAFMDRLFYAGRHFMYKPGACIVSARRAGTTAALDQMNKYLTISRMPVVSANYWNMVHGAKANEVEEDKEGMQVMRDLGRNMAWLLRCIEAGKEAGVAMPVREKRVWTNFIR